MSHSLRSFFLLIFLLYCGTANAQTELSYYLPQGVTYNPEIPTPKSYLGYEVGDWHVEHADLVGYFRLLAEKSDRITLDVIGRSHELRPLIHLTITSPRNHGRIEEIRKNHVAKTYPDRKENSDIANSPVVVWAGYGVHGNEPSTTNSALLVAYHLAAATGPQIEEMLNNMVVLLDPSLNPDGHNRFAHWANSNKSKNIVADPAAREHNETWPGGRTNHYWFDLNRDWLPVQHPESQARKAQFHKWKPNVVLDFHEMGTNSTYFFQPGIPTRNNPLTPKKNFELTAEIGMYNAAGLDEIGSLYYTKESFDDFYYGKGSTYPDGNGAIGILFEQASSRGHVQESVNGLVTFPFTIKNQFVVTLASLKASHEMRVKLLEYQKEFYDTAMKDASSSSVRAYVFGDRYDTGRTNHMAEMFTHHDINMYRLATDLTIDGKTYEAGSAYIIPTDQPQYRLITAMFERRTSFEDSLFYDISAWTIPLGYGMPYAELGASNYRSSLLGDKVNEITWKKGQVHGRSDYAYVFEWDEYYAPRLLSSLMQKGVRARVATSPFSAGTTTGVKAFDRGTILIPLSIQPISADEIRRDLAQYAERDGVAVHAVTTGAASAGVDLGSPTFAVVNNPNVLMLVGPGVTAGNAGETWHFIDQRFDLPHALVEAGAFGRVNLDKYTVIILPSGNYGSLGEANLNRLQSWVRGGGILITFENATNWARTNKLLNITPKSRQFEDPEFKGIPAYADMSTARAGRSIPGTIFEAEMDLTHPLAYGYNYSKFSIFKGNNIIFEPTANVYGSPVRFTAKPLQAGYASIENQNYLAGSPAVVVGSLGSGRIIGFTDSPNFRAFWKGTNKMLLNAMFFGKTISGGASAEEDEAVEAVEELD